MKNYKLLIQYDGTRYNGWQSQGNTENTIQGKIENVLSRLTEQPVKLHGSGRTDAGVHAMGQVANAFLTTDITGEEIKVYLNSFLPEDIKVLEVTAVSDRFHSRLNVVKKVYLYKIETDEKSDVFERKYVYNLGKKLNLAEMRKAIDFLCGTNDYKSFCGKASKKKTTVRTLSKIEVKEVGSQVYLYFEGNGFLHHMVRIMTGTLIEVGLGIRAAESMPALLQKKNRREAGYTVPAQGLSLAEVFYH